MILCSFSDLYSKVPVVSGQNSKTLLMPYFNRSVGSLDPTQSQISHQKSTMPFEMHKHILSDPL